MIIDSIKSAIDIGYRHFDCAANYSNEKSVGKAINDKIKEGVVKRDDLYITSKVITYIFILYYTCSSLIIIYYNKPIP